MDSALIDDPGTRIEIDRELAKRGYIHFVEAAWHKVEPAQGFINSWNVGAVCEHMQAIKEGQLKRLVINVPPNTSKSMTCTVMYDPWVWTTQPEKKFIHGCFDDKLARRDSLRAKNLIDSDWYQRRWGDVVIINKKLQETGEKYYTTAGGFRAITTPGGSVTGEHANTHIIDDPTKPSDTMGIKSLNQIEMVKQIEWWDGTLANRFVDFDNRVRVLVMQRLHEYDLSGVLKERGYEVLMIPMEFDPSRKCFTSIGWEDPRTEHGQLLCPERFSQDAVDELFEDMGGRGSVTAEAQLQQDPTPLSGEIFKRENIKYYRHLPKKFDKTCQSWDCTFKETGTSFVAGHAWGRIGPDYYIIDRQRGRWGLLDTCQQIRIMTLRWPRIVAKIIEEAANGAAVENTLRNEVSGLRLVPPRGGKLSRANAIEPLWNAGNIFFPHPSNCDWSDALLNFCVKFTGAKGIPDDDVDCMTQAVTYLEGSSLNKLRAAMKNVR